MADQPDPDFGSVTDYGGSPEDSPELIFFDPDDLAEEAEFIRVDDLFRREPEAVLFGPVFFTLFPRRAGTFLSGRLSRLFRRTLVLTGMQMEKAPERIRIRPMFLQWRTELSAVDDAGTVAGKFRADLESQADLFQDLQDGERFWADSCFVCPENERLTDEMINRMVARFQEPASGEEL